MRRTILWACVLLAALPASAITVLVPENVATIQDAIDVAMPGDSIVVMPGIYTGNGNTNLDFQGKDLLLIGEMGSAETIIDCEGDGRGLSLINDESSASLVQGFTIRNGYLEDDFGAGINCSCDTRFVDLVLESNTALDGGGLLVSHGSPVLDNVQFLGNASLINLTAGGAELCNGSNVILRNVVFRGNTGGKGGGLGICGTECFITVENGLFEDNHAVNDGGAIYCSGSTLHLDSCSFLGNHADDDGGAMRIADATLVADRCLFQGNSANSLGGALAILYDVGSSVSNSLIAGNVAGFGGGIYAGEFSDSADTRLRNVTMVGNRSTFNIGAGILAAWQAEVDLAECLIAENSAGGALYTDYGAAIHTACNNVYDNLGGNYAGDMDDQTGINGNISEDPMFCDSPHGDYSIANLSPCLPANNGCGVLMGRYGEGCQLTASGPEIPFETTLGPNHPNPFNPSTSIPFQLSEAGFVHLRIYDLAGRLVRTLLSGQRLEKGPHAIRWNGMDDSGRTITSGVYLCRFDCGLKSDTIKMMLVR